MVWSKKKKKEEAAVEAVEEQVEKAAVDEAVVEQTEKDVIDEERGEDVVDETPLFEPGSFDEWWNSNGLDLIRKEVSRKTLFSKALKAGNDATELEPEEIQKAFASLFDGENKPTNREIAALAFNLGN